MIPTIRRFYHRLNHWRYGITELTVIEPRNGVVATGFFTDENSFVKACMKYNSQYNIYAGRNPRPHWLPRICENYLDTKYKQRARDNHIKVITAVSLDIDPIRPPGTASTTGQHQQAIEFAIKLHNEIGGWVDDSGNGAYLWIPFRTPIRVCKATRDEIKQKCKLWQDNIIKVHQPDKYGLRIDGCFDLSRVKKVIGTMSVKGIHRLSRFVVVEQDRDDKVRNAILSLSLSRRASRAKLSIKPSHNLPSRFLGLLKTSPAIKELWLTPNNDTSIHDWMLGNELVKSGISRREDLARILMLNPFGKFQRDRRHDYIRTTVNKLTR